MIIISIHALREEGDDLPGVLPDEDKKFLSTPSARRATRPLRPVWPRRGISIHALREEGDDSFFNWRNFFLIFLSTPSVRRATWTRNPVMMSCVHFYPRPP